jgi:hypothetical protein
MKRTFSILTLVLGLFLTASVNYSQTSDGAFVGTWTLNTVKTKMQDFPREFRGYKIVLDQNAESLNIKNFVEGAIEPRFKDDNRRAATTQESIWGDSKQASSSGLTVKPTYGGSMALSKIFTPVELAYSLDGKEKNVDILQNGEVIGTAKTKAKLNKEGTSLEVTIVRKMKTMRAGQTEMTIYVREKWDVIEDGKALKYSKTVELPSARDDIILFFNKAEK